MRLGFFDYTLDLSVRAYIDNIIRELIALGVEVQSFMPGDPLPNDVDLYWDPRLTDGTPPWRLFIGAPKPCVVTVHGLASLSVLPWEYYSSFKQAKQGLWRSLRCMYSWWRYWRGRCAAIITVSAYDRTNIRRKLGLWGEKIVAIHHGLDHLLFRPIDYQGKKNSYFLHISQYQPRKNLHRIISAYQHLPQTEKVELVAVVPKYPEKDVGPGIKLIRMPLSHEELVPLYQNAIGFVFPSLHEGFGLPIIEAMACGCPVITSKVSACPEVAGDAAILVNPRSVEEIVDAMRRLIEDQVLRRSLHEKGIARAASFSWEKSAREHLCVFEEAVNKA